MTTIDEALAGIVATPAQILIVDICRFMDLFRRRDSPRWHPTAHPTDIQAAVDLLQLKTARPDAVHLVAPELVPGEYADHAERIENDFKAWFRFHDENQEAGRHGFSAQPDSSRAIVDSRVCDSRELPEARR